MIGSIIIKLKPQSEIKLSGSDGKYLYKLVAGIIKKNNKKIFQELHDTQKENSLTISPFVKGVKSCRNYTLLLPEQSAVFRITYLKEDFFKAILEGFLSLSNKKQDLPLSRGNIRIERVDWQQGTQAVFTSFEDILSHAQADKLIILEFCSPTFLGKEDGQKPFPFPESVFSSLFKKWNAHSEIKMPLSIQERFKNIEVTQFRLKTENTYLNQEKITGFRGKVCYKLPLRMDIKTKKAVNALADFSFYSGVGKGTIKGMGQARRIIAH